MSARRINRLFGGVEGSGPESGAAFKVANVYDEVGETAPVWTHGVSQNYDVAIRVSAMIQSR